ncbi:hypothetical protein HanPI659440_Chr16g0621321 [Helianthus annuus]|nr:hypothetical protein HanPI659440_Chr16g0621321 [Helianthus annuus]
MFVLVVSTSSFEWIIGFQLTTRWRFLQVTMLWSAAAVVDAQLYVISETIAQWYFSIDDPWVKHHMMFSKVYFLTVYRFYTIICRRDAIDVFGMFSGTIHFLGLLIVVVRIVRRAVVTAANEDASGLIIVVFKCYVNALLWR